MSDYGVTVFTVGIVFCAWIAQACIGAVTDTVVEYLREKHRDETDTR